MASAPRILVWSDYATDQKSLNSGSFAIAAFLVERREFDRWLWRIVLARPRAGDA
jgi:hypothetical protein